MNFDDTARFFGPSERLWPELFAQPGKKAIRLCRDCRRTEVNGIRRYCGKCLLLRQRKAKRQSARKRRSNVDKTEDSPLRTEALTHAEVVGRYNDPPTAISEPKKSTEQPENTNERP
jgi:hypothetical protein